MPRSYKQIQEQIAKLEAQAKAAKRKEAEGVIERIKEAIAFYDLTPADLFGKNGARGSGKAGKRRWPVKFSDGNGNTWVGWGKRPQWLKDALAAGKTLDDFRV